MAKPKANDYLRLIEEIENSPRITDSDKKKAVKAISEYANGLMAKTVVFNCSARKMHELMSFRATREGGEFWMGIQNSLRSSVR